MADTTQTAQKTKSMQLKVSMDGLRHNLARDYSELINYLNYTFQNNWEIDKDELAAKLLELRSDIAVLHCVFSTDEEQFSDLTDAIEDIAEITFSTNN